MVRDGTKESCPAPHLVIPNDFQLSYNPQISEKCIQFMRLTADVIISYLDISHPFGDGFYGMPLMINRPGTLDPRYPARLGPRQKASYLEPKWSPVTLGIGLILCGNMIDCNRIELASEAGNAM